jgi:hypothetical protein
MEENKKLEETSSEVITQEPSKVELEDLVHPETKKNLKKIKCTRCDSYILQPDTCVYTKLDKTVDIPIMKQKRELLANNQIENEPMDEFWVLNEMFTFENIGFTNEINKIKYLICADCEIGPLGYQHVDKPNEFLVSLNRVKHL